MPDTRYKDAAWKLPESGLLSYEVAQLAVMMDIRDELKQLNRLLGCHNFQAIPGILRGIRRKIPTPRPRGKGKR